MPRPPAPGRLLGRMLDDTSTPIYALDGERRIVFANPACADWLGARLDDLIGCQCAFAAATDETTDLNNDAIGSALCPPPEAFTGATSSGEVCRPAAPSRPYETRPATFVQLTAANKASGLLVIVSRPSQPDVAASVRDEPSLHALLVKLRGDLGKRYAISQLIGVSDAIHRVREQVRLAAESGVRTLVIGPPGSGREHVARTIHYGQPADSIGPLISIPCRLVDAEQMQARLTTLLRDQHERPTDRPPAALLLEVDRLRPDAQQELAGFLQLPKIELKTLATSRVSLDKLVAKNRFRADPASRLSTLVIRLPPLAARRTDIPLLAQHLLELRNGRTQSHLAGFQPAALELLISLPWKNNIDQLAEAVEQASARSSGPRIGTADFPDWVHLAQDDAARPSRKLEPIQLDNFLADIEKELLQRAMRAARGNKSKAAVLLGLSRQRLIRRLVQLGLAPKPVEEPVIFEPLPDES